MFVLVSEFPYQCWSKSLSLLKNKGQWNWQQLCGIH